MSLTSPVSLRSPSPPISGSPTSGTGVPSASLQNPGLQNPGLQNPGLQNPGDAAADRSASAALMRVGVVSYLNTLPLIEGLDQLSSLSLRHSVPSHLVDMLTNGEVDVALCSSIDFQQSPVPLSILPVGMLGCCGATLTVRLFSATPLDRIKAVHTDSDSHTSIALLRVLLRERFGIEPAIVPFDAHEHAARTAITDHPQAMLLIGDKVVNQSPSVVRYPYQLDLGAAWHEWTGLPFVFAIWMARADRDASRLHTIAAILDRQRRHNRERIDTIIARHADSRGWPHDLARRYLGECLRY